MESNDWVPDICDLTLWTTEDVSCLQDLQTAASIPQDFTKPPLHVPTTQQSGEESDDIWQYYSETSPQSQSSRVPFQSSSVGAIELEVVDTDQHRRRERNRTAQRAFRERKESKSKQREQQIAKLKSEQRQIEIKYHKLRSAHLQLKLGLKVLLDASGSIDELDAASGDVPDDPNYAVFTGRSH